MPRPWPRTPARTGAPTRAGGCLSPLSPPGSLGGGSPPPGYPAPASCPGLPAATRRAYSIGGAFNFANQGHAKIQATANSITDAKTSAGGYAITAGTSGNNADTTVTAAASKGNENNQAAVALSDSGYAYLVPILDNTLLPNGWPGGAAESAYLQKNYWPLSVETLSAAATNKLEPTPIPTP